MNKSFAAIYKPGPNWIPGKLITQQPLGDHVVYLRDWHARNVVKMAGPFDSGETGLVILEAANLAEAMGIIENDPAILSGTLLARVHEWKRMV